ncbi:hypothetical protein E4U57_005756, partial [Claviceps arundinis]
MPFQLNTATSSGEAFVRLVQLRSPVAQSAPLPHRRPTLKHIGVMPIAGRRKIPCLSGPPGPYVYCPARQLAAHYHPTPHNIKHPIQDGILEFAKPVIAISLGGGTNAKDGTSR